MPHAFTGNATIDGGRAAAGTEVTAWVEGYLVGSSTVKKDGSYGIVTHQPLDRSIRDKDVLFQLDGIVADQTGIWQIGGADWLDLTARSECEQPK